MTYRQIILTWLLLLLQGSRRLYESLEFSRPSKSRMWIGHWMIGIGFYMATSIAIWIEGIPLALAKEANTRPAQQQQTDKKVFAAAIQSHNFNGLKPTDFALSGPNLYTFLGLLLFILASGFQHDIHAYLASLRPSASSSTPSTASTSNKSNNTTEKTGPYTLPTHPAFSTLISPHYTAECLIYLSLTLIATPPNAWVNWTMFSAFVFVVVNLGVTANGTREWYARQFGPKAMEGKWRMVPFVF
ncbi:hypothetical protein LTR86_008010 [Recurvomyces mirabilis]|nr:hypothetical protein LTR86_008010 [Recurvomyces mirabilis]